MIKKVSKKVKRKILGSKADVIKQPSDHPEEDPKVSFDYDGLPSRDIKKNLGCA